MTEIKIHVSPDDGEFCKNHRVDQTKNQQDHSDFGAEQLNGFREIFDRVAVLQCQSNRPDVDQVKADRQQVHEGVCKLFAFFGAILKKYGGVPLERSANPHGDAQANTQRKPKPK